MKISKRGKIILLLLCVFITILTAWLTIRYLSTPKLDLISILPESPLGYVSAKNLDGIISAIEKTEFGKQLKTMPILQTIKSNQTWRQLSYQKALWEYQIQGRLDRDVLKDFAGKEVILSFYSKISVPSRIQDKNRNSLAFLLISQVSASGKMQVSATEMQDVVDVRYKMVKERYQDIEMITVVGFSEEFTYAFIGKIGLLSNDKTLVQDAIDIYKEQKTGFVKQHHGVLLQRQYKSNSSSLYFEPRQYSENLPFGTIIKSFLKDIKIWSFSNKYSDGKVISEHNFGLSNIHNFPKMENHQILPMAPKNSALLLSAEGTEPSDLWHMCRTLFGIEILYRDAKTELQQYLGKRINFIMLGSSEEEVRIIPSMAFLIPIKDVRAVEEGLFKLRNSILIGGKKLKFTLSQVYNGVDINPVELPLGFIFSLKGGYAIIDEYLVVGTTTSIIQQIIDTASGQQKPLNPMDYQLHLNSESTGSLFIHPPSLVPELQKMVSFYALIAGISKDRQASQMASQISKNLYPLSALEGISANFELHKDQGIAQVTIINKSN